MSCFNMFVGGSAPVVKETLRVALFMCSNVWIANPPVCPIPISVGSYRKKMDSAHCAREGDKFQ